MIVAVVETQEVSIYSPQTPQSQQRFECSSGSMSAEELKNEHKLCQ
jgi:hypothetical protein